MFSFFKKPEDSYKYSDLDMQKRESDIPKLDKEIDFDFQNFFEFEQKTKIPIPASINYLSKRDKIVSKKKEENVGDQEDSKRDMCITDMLMNPNQVDVESPDFSHIPKASDERIKELEIKHMDFYSLLSSIQETHIASDFRSAYDIQDKIAYLLNNRDLLFDSLVDKLLQYLDSIISKLKEHKESIDKKQAKFKSYNKSISELKEYKYKTDESMAIINENMDIAKKERDRNAKVLGIKF